ncbi:hypothetical protein KLP28_06270 [Nocardioidaceae bacterium]|nr:hypothetical protein KLP28_06270 [Nocardioidaceae bacterium]
MSAPVLIACGHGTRSGAGRAAVSALIGALALRTGDRAEVTEAYVDVHGPALPDVVARVAGSGARDVVVVPLLLSAGFHVKVDMAGAVAPHVRARVAPAMGPDPRLTSLLDDRLHEVGATPADLVLMGAAGSSDADAVADVEAQADLLRARWPGLRLGYGASARPRLGCESARVRLEHDTRLVALSYLLAPGFFHGRVEKCGAAEVTRPLVEPDREVDERLVDLLEARFDATLPA